MNLDQNVIFFNRIELTKNSLKHYKEKYCFRNLVKRDFERISMSENDFISLYGDIMIINVDSRLGTINLPFKKSDINLTWTNEFPKGKLESKKWSFSDNKNDIDDLIKSMRFFLKNHAQFKSHFDTFNFNLSKILN